MNRLVTLAFTLLTAFFVGGCGDDQIKRADFPIIVPDPATLTLSALPIGQSQQRTVVLRNAGQPASRLVITSIRFSDGTDIRELSLDVPSLPLTLRGHEDLTLHLTYAPVNEGSDSGEILVDSNDGDNPTLHIPIQTDESSAEISVQPPALEFGNVNSGASNALSVTVSNVGTIPVQVTDIELAPETSADFRITRGGAERPALTRETSLVVEVTYTPAGLNDDRGTLIIHTDNEDWPEIVVPLTGQEPSPDIEISLPSVSFGAVDLGGDSDAIPVIVTNVGSAPLSVDSLSFTLAEDGVNEQFQLADVPDPLPSILEAETSFTFTVSYHPRAEGRHHTAIEIRSNDPDEPVVLIPVDGRVRVPCIFVSPTDVSFGAVARGVDSAHQHIQVTNCGDLPLALTDLSIAGDAGFQWGWGGDGSAQAMLAPLETAEVEAWYSNQGLAEGAPAEAILSITNNTVDTPVVAVALHAQGGGAPSCSLAILGAPVTFGFVSRGTDRTRDVEILNRGTGNCEQRNESIAFIGLPPSPFTVRGHLPAVMPPGSRTPLTLAFHPTSYGPMAGTLTVTYWDPYAAMEKSTAAQLAGVGGDSNIEAIPGHLEFGDVTAGDCASRTERVTVYNSGLVDLCIQDIELVGEGCDEFFIVARPVANADGCIVVTRNTPAEVQLVYEPGNLGPDACELVFSSDASDTPELHVPLTGSGTADRHQVDEFVQGSGQEVDVLFVVDNSGSMAEEQDNLARNFSDFIRGADEFQNDFQLGVVTTEAQGDQAGWLIGEPRIIRRSPNTEAQFQDHANVGTGSLQDEHGLEAAHKALTDPAIFDTGVACQNDGQCQAPDRCYEGFCGGRNRGFIRDDAALELIFLSDEEDQSESTVNFYVDFFKSIKGFRNEARLHAHAIVGADDQGNASACQSNDGVADAGRRYVEVAQRTNGTVASICSGDFGNDLRAIGNSAFGLQVQFFLSRPAAPGTVTVEVDGQARAQGWSFDVDTNSVIFEDGSEPQPGAHIRISYDAQCFPRHDP